VTITPTTRVQLRDVDTGAIESICTLAEFFAANETIGADWQAEIAEALGAGRSYDMGGGAAPLVRVELLPPPAINACSAGHKSASHCSGLCRVTRSFKRNRVSWR